MGRIIYAKLIGNTCRPEITQMVTLKLRVIVIKTTTSRIRAYAFWNGITLRHQTLPAPVAS